ncbi:hypothetical protein PV326_007745 [Microctonus aethiopoides]|nr:hypothetical protein PV326_007745 [Microctonus aethiopoides]
MTVEMSDNLSLVLLLLFTDPPIVDAQLAVGYNLESLREGDDLKLVCSVQSNPSPIEIIWFHNKSIDTRLEHNVAEGILIATNTLTLRVLNLGHSGEYTCYGRNNIGDGRSLPLIIRMKFAPRCKAPYESRNIAVMLHDTVKLRCEVEAEPSDTVRFSWTFNETQGDVLPIQNSRPRNYELTSVLEYTPTTQGDYGTLGCWASNSVGRQKTPCLFHIVPASYNKNILRKSVDMNKAPKPLIDCTLHNDSSALEVNCIPGSDSGLPQHFLLEVRGSLVGSEVIQASQTLQVPQSDQGELGEGPPIYRIENSLPSFQLDYLEPGYDYTLAIYAVNKHGRSNPKRLRNVRIVEQLGNNMERSGGFVIKNLQSIIPNSATRNMIIYVAVILLICLVEIEEVELIDIEIK